MWPSHLCSISSFTEFCVGFFFRNKNEINSIVSKSINVYQCGYRLIAMIKGFQKQYESEQKQSEMNSHRVEDPNMALDVSIDQNMVSEL